VEYVDLDLTPFHALVNQDGQNPVSHPGTHDVDWNAELGFITFWADTIGGVGFSDGNVVGVVRDDTVAQAPTGGGAAPHGSQYYMLADTDGFAYVDIDPVPLVGAVSAHVSCWVHAEATSWEESDYIKVWATTGDGVETILLHSTDIDSLDEDAWFLVGSDMPVDRGPVSLGFGLQSDSRYEEAWFDYCKVESVVALADYVCRCSLGMTGSECEEDIDECQSAPCQNGAECAESSSSPPYAPVELGIYVCDCPVGWDGYDCEYDYDECSSIPCVNGACSDSLVDPALQLDEYSCECAFGWDGENCAVDIDECLANECSTGYACVDSNDNPFLVDLIVPIGTYDCVENEGAAGKIVNLATTASRNDEIDLSWNASDSNDNVTGHVIYASSTATGPFAVVLRTGPNATATVPNLAGSAMYFFRVAGMNAAGEGPASDAIIAYSAPARPATPTVARDTITDKYATTTSIDIQFVESPWLYDAPLVASHVYVAPGGTDAYQIAGAVPVGSGFYTVTGLQGGSSFAFKIASENTHGMSDRSLGALQAYTAPTAPTDVAFVSGTPHSVTMSWSAVSATDPVTGYHVYISDGDLAEPAFVEIQEVEPTGDALQWTATGLQGGARYYFAISGENNAGEGVLSAALTAYTVPVAPAVLPMGPGATRADYATADQITLGWNAVNVHPAAPIIIIRVWQDSILAATWDPTVGLQRNVTLTGLSVDTAYTYSLSVENRAGESERSVERVLYTVSSPPGVPNVVCVGCPTDANETAGPEACIPCDHPNATASEDEYAWYSFGTSLRITWLPVTATDPIVDYKVYTKLLSSSEDPSPLGATFELNGAVPAAAGQTYTATDLLGAAKYELHVRGRSVAGESEPVAGTGLVAYTAPIAGAPQQASDSTTDTIYLEWTTPVVHADRPLTKIELYYRHVEKPMGCDCNAQPSTCACGSDWVQIPLELDEVNRTISGLQVSNLYAFVIRAESLAGIDLSEVSYIGTTPPGMPAPPTEALVAATMYAVAWTELEQQGIRGLALDGYVVRAENLGTGVVEERTASYGDVGQFLVGVASDTTFMIRVAARNSYGVGPFTEPLAVVTPPGAGGG
jgi:hypothetical protein